jgi:uncharacterized protein YndB with AHSA1/START domain
LKLNNNNNSINVKKMSSMPRLEQKREINAPVERVYEILNDLMILPRWNIVVTEISELEKDKYFVKSNVGDLTNTVIENIPNERITSDQEGSPMTKLGYILTPKGEGVEVTLWGEFDEEAMRTVLEMAGDLFLKSLKVYVDHVTTGGNPEEYEKKLSVIKKA